MESATSITQGLLLCLLLIGAGSCNRYIDKATTARKVQVMQGDITFYPDSNVLIFRSNMGISMDTETYKSKPFYAKLPKGLKSYSLGLTTFKFYYPNKQVVAININLKNNMPVRDTTYVPTESELTNFINLNYPSPNDKYDMSKIAFKNKRNHLIMKKGAATIVLYNITPKNYNKFTEYLAEFKFL